MSRPKIPTPEHIIEQALDDYTNDSLLVEDIAKKYGFTEPTIVYWVKKYGERRGIKLHGRGCRPRAIPTVRERQILRRATEVPYHIVGSEFGVSRARVGKSVTTWKERGWVEPLTFKVKDIIRWTDQRWIPLYFEVLRIGTTSCRKAM